MPTSLLYHSIVYSLLRKVKIKNSFTFWGCVLSGTYWISASYSIVQLENVVNSNNTDVAISFGFQLMPALWDHLSRLQYDYSLRQQDDCDPWVEFLTVQASYIMYWLLLIWLPPLSVCTAGYWVKVNTFLPKCGQKSGFFTVLSMTKKTPKQTK